ncbi:hypothetical protein [Butyrivibrio sp. VCD2006]|nr:hypothetical protein [Butyrivibrio sp. VCD2006]
MIISISIYETAKKEEIIDERAAGGYEKEQKSKIIDDKKPNHL